MTSAIYMAAALACGTALSAGVLRVPVTLAASQPATTTIILVRHAEAQPDAGADPGLSAAGRARAALLPALLRDANVRAVYTTQYTRTRDTGATLADAVGARRRTMPVAGALDLYVASVVRDVFAEHGGQTVVIVGHSNTVPALVKGFTGIDVDPIAHDTYDHVFIVSTAAPGVGTLIRMRYGV